MQLIQSFSSFVSWQHMQGHSAWPQRTRFRGPGGMWVTDLSEVLPHTPVSSALPYRGLASIRPPPAVWPAPSWGVSGEAHIRGAEVSPGGCELLSGQGNCGQGCQLLMRQRQNLALAQAWAPGCGSLVGMCSLNLQSVGHGRWENTVPASWCGCSSGCCRHGGDQFEGRLPVPRAASRNHFSKPAIL